MANVISRIICLVDQNLHILNTPIFVYCLLITFFKKLVAIVSRSVLHTLKRISIRFKEETKPRETWAVYFPAGGPVVRTLWFHHQGPGSIAGWGTKIPYAPECSPKKKKRQAKIWHLCYHYPSSGVMVGIYAFSSFGKTPVQTISHLITIKVKIRRNVKYHL